MAETNILDLPMQHNDAEATTVREYLNKLLAKIITDEECFSGKRPFGNSGWKHELYKPLVEAGLVSGYIDEDGFLEDYDAEQADKLLLAAINNR